jgi:glucose-6-phosphate isomerase, archaeal
MSFYPGINLRVSTNPMGFEYGPEVFGPEPEYRRLDSIRQSLHDAQCDGPDPVYAIAMDVGEKEHRQELEERMLLYGVVVYAKGRLGQEPVRSQGHVHKVSSHSNCSPPELYEIWQGRAFVYMQESVLDEPGRCYAVEAVAGDKVLVPPGWAHATISADPQSPLVFGAWCDREYGFEYGEIRARRGLAWYPLLSPKNEIEWHNNEMYKRSDLVIKRPRQYRELALDHRPIYQIFRENREAFNWIPYSSSLDIWKSFEP